MRIPVCVLRNHKPRHPSACYRQACANQHHASNSKYKCFGRGARTAATFATDFERPPRRTIRDRNLVTSAGTGSTYRKPLSSSTTPYRQKSSPGIYHLAGSVESQPDASSLSLVYRCATRSALWANNKSVKRCNVGFGKVWRCNSPHVYTVLIKKPNRAEHSFTMRFNNPRHARQHFLQRRACENHSQYFENILTREAFRQCAPLDWALE
jgi:hypothetical protein